MVGATVHAGRQFLKSAESGASVWSGLEDSRHECIRQSRSQVSGNNVMHVEMYIIRLRKLS